MRVSVIGAGCAWLALLPLAGCATYRETQPAQTATQQLLISHAAEMAAARLAAALPLRTAVFVDAAHFKGEGSDYALGAIEAALLRRGMTLAPDRKSSRVTLALRMGALSIDQKDTILGLPETTLPIPGTITAFTIPEISVYSAKDQIGKAEFAAFAYDTATGAPIAFAGPVGAQRKLVSHHYLTVFGTGSQLERPAGAGRK